MADSNFTVKGNTLNAAAARIIAMIKERTSLGIDRNGRPFEPYSRRPFAMPLGAFFERTTGRQRTRLNKEGDLEIFRNKRTGKRWVIIDGGYLNFKSKWSPTKAQTVNLQWRGLSGGMLGQLKNIGGGDNYRVIGFRTAEAAELAFIHSVGGAGKRRIIRDFLGITEEEIDEIKTIILNGLELKVGGIKL
jgi:hypothetical protein